MRLGAMTTLIDSDSIYAHTINKLKELGATVIEFTPPEIEMKNLSLIINTLEQEAEIKRLEAQSELLKKELKTLKENRCYN